MSENNGLTVYPDQETADRLRAFQKHRKLTTSKAATRLIKAGLDQYDASPFSNVYRYLGSVSVILAVVFWAFSKGWIILSDALPFYSFWLFVAALGFVIADHYNFSVLSLLRRRSDESAAAARSVKE